MAVAINIITCPQWDARPPRADIVVLRKKAARGIFHHTAGHHREIENPANESLEEAKRYARDIQAYHMDSNGWIDSGHNFLVTRAGHILQGRWITVSAIEADRMVQSAHCPGQNDQIGVEHEHRGLEPITEAQMNASARLWAWIAWQYGRSTIMPVYPHSDYLATACPGNLKADIPRIRAIAASILKGGV